jgi:molybdopterin synthase catalytic subunit
VADQARSQWPAIGRLALLHRVGTLALGEVSVVVGAAAPHRAEAFAAARFCIDTLKETVPIWKKENWEGGSDWGLDASEVSEVGR